MEGYGVDIVLMAIRFFPAILVGPIRVRDLPPPMTAFSRFNHFSQMPLEALSETRGQQDLRVGFLATAP